ncbi:MAG TPA: biotin--[acetyl-CoA-carboxylase] ligase [Nitrospiraceae bacterium]|nr:biotin--[acetyl-CoA-carboxylase] ligase [Nitrospiraceae bacterium]
MHVLSQTDSTNSALLKLAQAGAEHGTVVCADHQTAGCGRRGRSWFSRPGDGLCFSLLLRGRRLLSDDAHWPAWVPLASGTAVALGIADTIEVTPQLKWPNDLLLGGRKLGGILSESLLTTQSPPFFIVGIGLNVNLPQKDLPEELRDTATSLIMATGRPVNRAWLLSNILKRLEEQLEPVLDGEIAQAISAYTGLCATIGRQVSIEFAAAPPLIGLAEAVAPDGALLVQSLSSGSGLRKGETVAVRVGDVVHLR